MDWENDIIEGDNITPDNMQWMQNQPFNGTVAQMMTMLQSDLKADSGANQFTRGETTGGIVSGKAINSLIQAGGKIASMRTEQLKYGFKQIVEQIIWLMAQFYDSDRVVMITGRSERLHLDVGKMFGRKTKGAVNPPPYTVQIEVSSRDPQRIANQNQMFIEAYNMAAQAQQFFPVSALFRILNLDGKDKVLPVIEANEHYQEQMQALQQQVEELSQQLQNSEAENQSLRRTATDLTNTRATAGAKRTPSSMQASSDDPSAIVEASRNTLGVPTGMQLPT
jgi:hypothetical protein